MSLASWAKTEIGLVRSSNQDAVGCFPEQGLFVVADGMGGHANGEIASRMAVELLQRHLEARPDPGPDDLVAAVHVANAQIFDVGHRDRTSPLPSMGTTIVALLLAGERAAWIHVGDSRLYRLRGDELVLLTADDTRYGRQIDPGGPIPLELPHTNELLCALGVERYVQVTVGEADLAPRDVYLLCSDGISGLVSPDTIRDELRALREPEETGRVLLECAMRAGGNDNASLVLIQHRPD